MAQLPNNNNSSPDDPLNDSFNGNADIGKEIKCYSAYSSVENSPLLDRDSIMRCSVSSRDEFWDALSSNYDYLMDDGLIATCREASSDLSLDDESELPETSCWSFTSFIEQFKELHDLLHDLQINKDDNNSERTAKIYEDQQKAAYLCKLFNEQAQKLCKRYPDMRDEVHRRLNLLNNKWKAVEHSINPNIVKSPSKDGMFDEITNRMCNLRKWLRELENRLFPISPNVSWPVEVLEEKYKVQNALQKEIEGKGKSVSILLKLCEHLKGNVRFGQHSLLTWDAERVRKVAKNLEHRWHSLWLQSLERQCILEDLLRSSKGVEKLDKSFSEEPVKKYPRLGDKIDPIVLLQDELKSKMSSSKLEDAYIDGVGLDAFQHNTALQKSNFAITNDKGVMVGDTGIAELKAGCAGGTGKFEIVQDIGYSSETSAHLSTDERADSADFHRNGFSSPSSNSPQSSPSGTNGIGSPTIYLAPDKYPSVSLRTFQVLSEDRSSYGLKHNAEKRAPDTFYKVACIDDDAFDDATVPLEMERQLLQNVVNTKVCDQESLVCSDKINGIAMSTPNVRKSLGREQMQHLLKNIEKEVALSMHSYSPDRMSNSSHKKSRRKSQTPPNSCSQVLQRNEILNKSARVSEWLEKCPIDDCPSMENLNTKEKSSNKSDVEVLNSKEKSGSKSVSSMNSCCDASGECTTNESDSEKSNASDVNNSVTFSQSFTGSIETVIPVLQEDTNTVQKERSGSLEPSPTVRMRKKKRINRDRPWSVIELTSFTPASVPHSTSEGALDLLYSSQDSSKTQTKKLSSKNKRLSLTDMSSASCLSRKSHKFNQKLANEQNHQKSCSSIEKLLLPRKNESVSDQSSDNCCTNLRDVEIPVLVTEKILVDTLNSDEVSKCENFSGVQVILSETNSLHEMSLSADTDVTGCAASIEDQGSISDQAWDEYQDPPYLSEPYSEATMDEDEIRKLTCFGDDYRASLGSYSDASSISLKLPPPRSRTRTRSSFTKSVGKGTFSSDSNSDSEDFHHILETSNKAYQLVKEKGSKALPYSSEVAELVATCQTNLCHLKAIANAECELESVSKEDVLKLKNLIKDWEELNVKISSLSRSDKEPKVSSVDIEAGTVDVHSSLATLKEKLSIMAEHATDAVDTAVSLEQVTANIQNLQAALSNLQDIKDSVLSVSARILRLIAEGGGHPLPSLKENATKLYQQWEDVYELNCSQLTKLQNLQAHWAQSTEEDVKEDLETTVQWQPVQVGNNLPQAEVTREDLHQNTAAEVQVADQLDVALEMETDTSNASIKCVLVERKKEELKEPLLHLSRPIQKKSTKEKKRQKTEFMKSSDSTAPPRNRSCLWRALIASVPIQFALVILYYLSCHMEPQCCENINNYDFSILPQLRYLRGPPPV